MRRLALLALLCLAAAGCRHKVQPVPPLAVPPSTPVWVGQPSEQATVAPVPAPVAPAIEARPPARKVSKPKKKAAPPPVPAPALVASATTPPPPGASLGSLSTGGDDSPEQRQKATELIGDLDKRVAALPPNVVKNQKQQVTRARFFLDEARKALKGGDAQGAVTLATKARVLLEDLTK